MINIYMIRHGQTDWNVAGKIQGKTDIPLNETGRRQAVCLAKGMANRPVVQIFSSDLLRARETAGAIGDSQHVAVETLPGLEEIGFGKWEGMTLEEIQAAFPEEYEKWCENPVTVAPPGGESLSQIKDQCQKVMEEILKRAKGDLAIVSHGAMLAYVVEYLMRNDPNDQEIIVGNASITTIRYEPESGRAVLIQANDQTHLAELTS